MTTFTLESLSKLARDGNITEIQKLLKNDRCYEYYFSCLLYQMCCENNLNVIKQLIGIYDGDENCFERAFFNAFGLMNKELTKIIIETYSSKLDLNGLFDEVCFSDGDDSYCEKMIEWLFNNYPIDTTKLNKNSLKYISLIKNETIIISD